LYTPIEDKGPDFLPKKKRKPLLQNLVEKRDAKEYFFKEGIGKGEAGGGPADLLSEGGGGSSKSSFRIRKICATLRKSDKQPSRGTMGTSVTRTIRKKKEAIFLSVRRKWKGEKKKGEVLRPFQVLWRLKGDMIGVSRGWL